MLEYVFLETLIYFDKIYIKMDKNNIKMLQNRHPKIEAIVLAI